MVELLNEFDSYVRKYNIDDPKIKLKYNHSYRVMDLCRQIAESIGLNDNDVKLAMIIGILHDYARFEQWSMYKTYSDMDSVDHGDLAVELLFEKNEIENFNIKKEDYSVVYDAIKYHNKYEYPEHASQRNKLFCQIIKDADKLDIFYLLSIGEIKIVNDDSEISDEIKDEFYKENLLKREQKKTKSDIIVFYLAMIYDMNFKYSYKFLKQNKLIEKLFEFIDSKEKFRPYFNYIGKYMKEGKEYVRSRKR